MTSTNTHCFSITDLRSCAAANDEARAPTDRLENILAWLRTAKESLPAINDGLVSSDRIAAASALVDRMHRQALAHRARHLGDAVASREARRAA